MYDFTNLHGQIRWYRIADLVVLLCPVPLKKVVVGKGLDSGRLSHGKASTLARIVMNIVVAIFGYV